MNAHELALSLEQQDQNLPVVVQKSYPGDEWLHDHEVVDVVEVKGRLILKLDPKEKKD